MIRTYLEGVSKITNTRLGDLPNRKDRDGHCAGNRTFVRTENVVIFGAVLPVLSPYGNTAYRVSPTRWKHLTSATFQGYQFWSCRGDSVGSLS